MSAGDKGSRPNLPLLALSLGHGCADMSGGALWALLPFLVVERDYSYAAVGVFALVATVSTAVLQPLLGAHGDRRTGWWLMPVGLVLAGLGLGAVGVVASFPLTLAAVLVASAGVAAFHPEGARWARLVSGGHVTSDMGVFSLGGSVGYALGPLVVAAALAPLGLSGTLLLPLAPFAVAAVLLATLRRVHHLAPGNATGRPVPAGRQDWPAFARLLAFSCGAGAVATGLITYVPLFLVQERSTSPEASNVVSSVLLAAGAAGTLLGGLAAQRYGRRRALVASQLLLVPFVAVLPALGYTGVLAMAVPVGLAMNAYLSITLVLAQEYLPARMGLATGLTVGLANGAGGLVVAALGLLGDAAGAAAVLFAVAALPLLVGAVGLSLPRPRLEPAHTAPGLEVQAED